MPVKFSAETQRLLERFKDRFKGKRALQLLGFRLVSLRKGRATMRMDSKEHHTQSLGLIHGGILAALADTTAGFAAFTTVPRGTAIATIELKINYLEPVDGGRIRSEARVLRAGRNFIVTECEIFDKRGKLAAKALLTFGAARGHSLGN